MTSLPLNNTKQLEKVATLLKTSSKSKMESKSGRKNDAAPAFYVGNFVLPENQSSEAQDTFLITPGWGRVKY